MTPTLPVSGDEITILAFGTSDDGAMADPICDATMESCEWLLAAGLLCRGAQIGEVRVYRTTAAGRDAIRRAVN